MSARRARRSPFSGLPFPTSCRFLFSVLLCWSPLAACPRLPLTCLCSTMGKCSKCGRLGHYAPTCSFVTESAQGTSTFANENANERPPESATVSSTAQGKRKMDSDAFQCVICATSPMRPPIFLTCVSRCHVVCSTCHPKLKDSSATCPMCRDPMPSSDSRNTSLEKMISDVSGPIKCFNGCGMTMAYNDFLQHENVCAKLMISCPICNKLCLKTTPKFRPMLDSFTMPIGSTSSRDFSRKFIRPWFKREYNCTPDICDHIYYEHRAGYSTSTQFTIINVALDCVKTLLRSESKCYFILNYNANRDLPPALLTFYVVKHSDLDALPYVHLTVPFPFGLGPSTVGIPFFMANQRTAPTGSSSSRSEITAHRL